MCMSIISSFTHNIDKIKTTFALFFKKMSFRALLVFSLFLSCMLLGSAEQCGVQAGGALCPGGLCCSQYGWCGTTDDYCTNGCQSQCGGDDDDDDDTGGGDTGGGLGDLVTKEMFEEMLLHRNNQACTAAGFYTYDAFIEAAKSFPDFASTGDDATRLREVAAFLGQTSHETTGGAGDWNPPGGPYAWGYCFNREVNPPQDYCDRTNQQYPCATGQTYIGRGPIQLSWNYNYGQFGSYLGVDLLNNPDLLATDAVISFKSAFWFWMTAQPPKPSCHDVIIGAWTPSDCNLASGRVPGYGVITNIINGGIECGQGSNPYVEDRIGFYKRYCDMLGVSYGDNLDCYSQTPFGNCPTALAEM
ncbi:hypothetical protein PTKIN_Ptkin02bG0224000 [Pterospermum kingtungense]